MSSNSFIHQQIASFTSNLEVVCLELIDVMNCRQIQQVKLQKDALQFTNQGFQVPNEDSNCYIPASNLKQVIDSVLKRAPELVSSNSSVSSVNALKSIVEEIVRVTNLFQEQDSLDFLQNKDINRIIQEKR